MAENTLGMSSLDRLREMKEESERRQAEAHRRILEIPIGEVRPDQHQVRTDFVADIVAIGDHEDLEGLARNIAAIGIHNPIHVRPAAEGGYVIISGERRWRAAGQDGLETVPCLLTSEEEHDPGQNTLTQLSENLQRSNLKLLDIAQALQRCVDETGLTQSKLAKELGKSKSWVSKYLALLRAKGIFQDALVEGYLRNPETARMYGRLDQALQEKLLRRARKEDSPVSHSEVAKLDRRLDSSPVRAPEPAATEADGGNEEESHGVCASQEDTPRHEVRLTSGQLRELIGLLGGSPDDDKLVDCLLALLLRSDPP